VRKLVVVFAAMLIGACSPAAPATPANHTITGTLSFRGFTASGATECTGAYSIADDLETGMQVVLLDEAGTTIGAAELTNAGRDVVSDNTHGDGGRCTGAFSFAAVPDAAFYRVRLGVRTSEQYSKADLEASGWNLDLLIK